MVDITAPRMMQDSMIRVYKNAYTDEFCDSVIDTWESLTKTEEEDKNHDWSEVGKRRDKAIFMDEWSDDTSESEIATRRLVAEGVASVLAPSVNSQLRINVVFNDYLPIRYT